MDRQSVQINLDKGLDNPAIIIRASPEWEGGSVLCGGDSSLLANVESAT
jgi:hypothetical protein